MFRIRFMSVVLGALAVGAGLAVWAQQPEKPKMPRPARPLQWKLTSPAFAPGAAIPPKYTCDGADVSPPLAWSNPPTGTKSFVVLMYDIDAPRKPFDHWVVCDLPAGMRSLPENASEIPGALKGARQLRNDFGKAGYGGPCPPSGKLHHYHFRIYAMDATLQTRDNVLSAAVNHAIYSHRLAQTDLVGVYERR